ncbi:2-isopropylmalate synthase [Mucisphaera calidilacus]|uniref:2-isopropylmalate synthase n=1 Tax=Mucisphaera calidilacus TaxID=2527982 RepID=A0A518BTW8_9BACT|nr:2-isopropylmalate synthase [Mucisphaera calidilacus]QDU70422.1 2-isopropylmalate synthase [Mucisphaera calidilacus]
MATTQTDDEQQPTTRIRIFDTTLRDGEQSPGASLNHAEKVEIARQLERLGVDVIEAGFPITSVGDFESVRAIGQEVEGPIVAGLSRCVPRDIDRAGEALKDAHKPRIHVFCATSKIHREHKLRKAFDEIVKLSVDSVRRAREFVDDVEFSPEDGSRTELNYLAEITAAVIEAGATTVNIPDTVGYSVPAEYGHIFAELRRQIPEIDRDGIYLSSHCHNDLGLAVANSLAAVAGGARQVECTINGIGERAGNAALEEIVMALRTRSDHFGRYVTNIDTTRIYPTSRMVSSLTGLSVQRNKAVVGDNAFAHESGIHQDGVLKHRETYEIMDPRDIGVPASKLVLGKHSGRHALADRLEQLGYSVEESMLQQVYERFKALADKKKDVYDEDIEAIVDQLMEKSRALWTLKQFQVIAGTGAMPTATVTLADSSGQEKTEASVGDGPVDAIYSAIQSITGVRVRLEDFATRSITQGKDAQGEVQVRVDHHGQKARGRGLSTDTVEAATLAYLAAINRIRTAPLETAEAEAASP